MESWEEGCEDNEIMELFCSERHKKFRDFEREASAIFKSEHGGVKDQKFSDFLLKYLEARKKTMPSDEPGPEERLKFCQMMISKVVNDEKKIKEQIYFPESQKPVKFPRIVFLAKDYGKGSFEEIGDYMVPYLSLQREEQFPHFLGFHFSPRGFTAIWIKGQLSEGNVLFLDFAWALGTLDTVIEISSHNELFSPLLYDEFYKFYSVMEFIKKVVHL